MQMASMVIEVGLAVTRDELAKIMEELPVRKILTSMTILYRLGQYGSSSEKIGAAEVEDTICAPVTRIDVPGGKDPKNRRQPLLPMSDWIMIDTVGPPPPAATVDPLLSNTRVAPACSVILEIVTVIGWEPGFAATMPLMLMFSVMLPCTTTLDKTTLTHDVFTVVFAVASVVPTVLQFGRITSPLTQSSQKKNIVTASSHNDATRGGVSEQQLAQSST